MVLKDLDILPAALGAIASSLQHEQKIYAQEQIKIELSQKVLNLRGRAGEAKQLMSRVEQMEKLFKSKQDEKQNGLFQGQFDQSFLLN